MQLIHKLVIGGLALVTWLPVQASTHRAESTVHSFWKGKQEREISGVVRFAATKLPVSGANVQVDGFSATITDDNGAFTIKVPTDGVKVTVQYAGHQENMFFVHEEQSTVEVLLYEEGYNPLFRTAVVFNENINKLAVAGAVDVVDLRPYQWNVSTNENTATFLQGKVAGLNAIRSSGSTNSGSNLSIRGINSLYGTSKPLLVVDGMLYEDADYSADIVGNYFESGLANIDIRDIDNITVLKDGSSLYGTKGSNGVVFISTSHASELATRINFGAYTSFNQKPKNLPLLHSNDYRSYISELLGTQGLSSAAIAQQPYFAAEPNTADHYTYFNDTDWQSVVMDNSVSQNYFLKVSGGDNIAKYALSAGYVDDNGLILTDKLSKYLMRLNADLNLSPKFTVQSNLSFNLNRHDIRTQGIDSYNSPLYTALVKSPILSTHISSADGQMSPLYSGVDIFSQTNPAVLVSDKTIGHNQSYRFTGNFHFNFKFNDRYAIKSIAGLVYDKGRENFFLPEIGVYAENLPTGVVRNQSGAEVRRLFSIFNDTYLHANNQFSVNHKLNTRAGIRIQTNKSEYDYGLGFNSANDDYVTLGAGSNLLRQVRGGFGNWNWLNVYMNNNYAYKSKYLLSWDVAFDGSSRFGENPQHTALKFGQDALAFNSALTAAWVVSAEDFFQSSAIKLLKIRGSFGLSGNDDIGDYSSKSFYISQNFLGVQGLIRGNIGNPNLQWERALKSNIGIDASFAEERLNLTLDVYNNTLKDLVTYQALQAYSGMDVVFRNGAEMRNRGVELGLNGRVVQNRNTKFDIGIQLAKYENKVTNLPDGSFENLFYGGRMITQVGGAANQFYGLQTAGIYTTEQEASNAGLSRQLSDGTLLPFQGGDRQFVDQNGDGIIDASDRVVIGNPNPDWFGSFTTALQYKRWTFNTLFTYSIGNDVYNATRHRLESSANYDNQSQALRNRWKQDGQETNIPRAYWGDPLDNAEFSDHWIEDGSYLRLRTLNIGYRLPIDGAVLKSVDFYAMANNLFTFSKYMGYDPEFSANNSIFSQGIDIGLTPQFRTYQLGVRVGF
ncbi:SusC/RagA family TonB-linked outer membrane protein [Sphingobacterium olei]|uniref:SusC/RagA family TonB-linked outer membrane protein n=1 Tax=Sphingobacterium olei TaxID=2571155 RepID=A0A4U0P3R1_9SPHI|nr:SusC/RagA family TonB-linked outer membrane protein [Sphingobacterium olei]TJZ61800.1 SusC/RagA family TonB-linked outer membrane protein [Sphingobacterium olei]